MIQKVLVLLVSVICIGCSGVATAQPTVEVENTPLAAVTFQPAFTPTVTFTPPPTSTPIPIPTMIPINFPYVADVLMDPSCAYTLTNVYTGDSAVLQLTSFHKKEHVSIYGQRTLIGSATIHYQTSDGLSEEVELTCQADYNSSCAMARLIEFPSSAIIVYGYVWKPPTQAPYYMFGQNADIYLTLPTGWNVQTDCDQ